MTSLTWLGVAGVELCAEGSVLHIDPFFTRPGPLRLLLNPLQSRADACPEVQSDAILVTHAHYDHLLDVPRIAMATGATVYGSPNVCRLLAISGVPSRQLRSVAAGDRLAVGPFRVQVLSASHCRPLGISLFAGDLRSDLKMPLRARDYRMDLLFSLQVTVRGIRLLNWTGVEDGPAPEADVLLPKPSLSRSHCVRLLQQVKPRVVMPIHSDNFLRPPPSLMLRDRASAGTVPPRWIRALDAWRYAVARSERDVRLIWPHFMCGHDLEALVRDEAGGERPTAAQR
jgi:L-ascorbate metabolism protein UlaG (beta-lactamase superfamily)